MHHPFLLILWFTKPVQGESKSNNLVIEHFISSVWSTHFLSTKASRQVTLQSVHSLIQNALWICRCVHLSMQHAPTHSCMHPHAHRWLNKSNLYAMSKEATHTHTHTHTHSAPDRRCFVIPLLSTGPAVSTPRSTLLAALQSTSNARLAQSLRHMDRSEPFVVISLWRAYLTKAQRTATCRDEHAGARDWLLNTA